MSDALTDISRDERRSRLYGVFLETTLEFLKKPSAARRKAVLRAAEETDSVRRGYWNGETNLSKNIDGILDKLQAGDKDQWARFLFSLGGDDRDSYTLKKFKAISPFAGKLLISVDYGCGFVTIRGELESLMEEIIRGEKKMMTYDTDKYLVALDMSNIKKADVLWMGAGTMGIKGPRKVE